MPVEKSMTTPLFNALRRLWELLWPRAPQPAPAYAKAPAHRAPYPIRQSGAAQPGEWRPLWRGPQSERPRTTRPLSEQVE